MFRMFMIPAKRRRADLPASPSCTPPMRKSSPMPARIVEGGSAGDSGATLRSRRILRLFQAPPHI